MKMLMKMMNKTHTKIEIEIELPHEVAASIFGQIAQHVVLPEAEAMEVANRAVGKVRLKSGKKAKAKGTPVAQQIAASDASAMALLHNVAHMAGSLVNVGKLLGLPPSSVHNWNYLKRIPDHRIPELRALQVKLKEQKETT